LDVSHTQCHGREGYPLADDPRYSEYEFWPKPPGNPPVIPHIGLLHCFNNPECARTPRKFFARIPKRVHGKLPGDEGVVWGVQLQQGLCNLSLWTLLVVIWFVVAFADWWISGYFNNHQKSTVLLTPFIAIAVVLMKIRLTNAIHYHNLPHNTTTNNCAYMGSQHNVYNHPIFNGDQRWTGTT